MLVEGIGADNPKTTKELKTTEHPDYHRQGVRSSSQVAGRDMTDPRTASSARRGDPAQKSSKGSIYFKR